MWIEWAQSERGVVDEWQCAGPLLNTDLTECDVCGGPMGDLMGRARVEWLRGVSVFHVCAACMADGVCCEPPSDEARGAFIRPVVPPPAPEDFAELGGDGDRLERLAPVVRAAVGVGFVALGSAEVVVNGCRAALRGLGVGPG